MKAFAIVVTLACLPAVAAEKGEKVEHRQPAASSVFPMGAQPGQTFEAEILGEYLDRASRILCHNPGVSAEVLSASPTRVRARIQVDAAASWGPHPCQVISPRGASAPVLIRITDQPHLLEKEPNSTLQDAQRIDIPATLMARLNTDGDFDFYRFHAAKGSRWIFDLRAARNGNSLDAALFLLDAEGRKIDYNEERFIWDPFLAHEFHSEGDYILVVQPTHRNNDPAFAYELDIRQAPHLDTIAPISLLPGRSQEVTLYGAGLYGEARIEGVPGSILAMEGRSARARIELPAGAPQGPSTLTLVTPAGRSNPVSFLIDATPRHTGGDRISPPVSITGVARYREPDIYRFTAKKGQRLAFEVRGQRFGSPVDLTMRLVDSAGKQLALNDDFAFAGAAFYNQDPRISHTFAQDGDYAIELRNTVNISGEDHPYQLLVTPAEPSFELQFASERPHVNAGGTAPWKINAVRLDGHNDPIALKLESLPPGVTAEPVVIPPGKNEAEFQLKAVDAAPGQASFVTVSAGPRAAWRSVRISSGGGEGATFARVDKALLVVSEAPHFSLEAQIATVNVPRGGSAVIPVNIRWEENFQHDIAFRLENLPPGITLDSAVAKPGAQRIDLTIRASQQAPLGRAPRIAILGQAGAESQQAPKITVQVD